MEKFTASKPLQLHQEKEKLLTLKKSTQLNMEKLESGYFGKELLTDVEKREKINQLEKNIYRIESLIKIVDIELKKFEVNQKIQELEKIKNSIKSYQEKLRIAKERKTDTESKIQDFQSAQNSKKEINMLIEDFKRKYPDVKFESLNIGNLDETFEQFKSEIGDLSKKETEERKAHLENFSKSKVEKDFLSNLSEEKLIEEQRLLTARLRAEYNLNTKEEEKNRKTEYQRRIDLIESILKEKEAQKLKTNLVTGPEIAVAEPSRTEEPARAPRERAPRVIQNEPEINYPPHIRDLALGSVLKYLKIKEETGTNQAFITLIRSNLENIIKKILKESTPQERSIKLFKEEKIEENTKVLLDEMLSRVNEPLTQPTEVVSERQPSSEIETQSSGTIIPRIILGRETQNTSNLELNTQEPEVIVVPQPAEVAGEKTETDNKIEEEVLPEVPMRSEAKSKEERELLEKDKLIKPEIESNIINFNGNETVSFKNIKKGPLMVDILLVKNGGVGSINLKKYLEKGDEGELIINIDKLVKYTKLTYTDIDYINVNYQNTAIYSDFSQFMYCLKLYEERNPELFK